MVKDRRIDVDLCPQSYLHQPTTAGSAKDAPRALVHITEAQAQSHQSPGPSRPPQAIWEARAAPERKHQRGDNA
eukprot:13938602-Alexandrium_andersonii.AAC.1